MDLSLRPFGSEDRSQAGRTFCVPRSAAISSRRVLGTGDQLPRDNGGTMSRQPISVDGIATPVGPFSPAVAGTATVYLSGQVAQDPHTGALVGDDAASQARQVLTNVKAVLEACGKSESDVLRVALYLTDLNDFAAVNSVYGEFFTAPYPARTAIAVAGLPLGALVEADVVVG
jgi:2-iminobutanoate/2-iminopropanoate deaminase